jgi:hypothetical protein
VAIDVVDNDTDIDGEPDPSTVEVVVGPLSGRITNINSRTGVITYRPNANWSGADSFTYRIRDDGSPDPPQWSMPATVSVTTDPVPDFPIADAGEDQTVYSNDLVTLDGSSSYDPDGGTLRYFWVYSGTLPLSLEHSDTAKPTFTAPFTPTALLFSLTVLDEEGLGDTTPDTVLVDVKSRPPHADAGPDIYVDTGELVTLSGAGCMDLDGDTNLTYVWAQVDGEPPVTLRPTAGVVAPTFTAPISPTVLTFWLYVYDSFGTHDVVLSKDEVRVFVQEPTVYRFYLPQITRYHCATGGNCGPDLAVQRLTVTRNDIELVITNRGSKPVTHWFWVDAYINPRRPPTAADPWWDLGSSGIMWKVTSPALNELVPGGSLVLNRSNWFDPAAGYSVVRWPLSTGTMVYGQVDVYPSGGQVPEINERNNRAGPILCCP